MSELRETIAETVELAMIDGWHGMPESKLWYGEKDQHTDAAIAAFEAALLSPATVEAGAVALYGTDPGKRYAIEGENGYEFLDEPVLIPWAEIPEHIQERFLGFSHDALTAALAAMKQQGETEGEGDD